MPAPTRLEVKRIAGTLGAEVLGADLASLDDETFSSIHKALLDHHVLVFRGQKLRPEDQIAFGNRFGDLHVHPIVPCLEGYPPVMPIGNSGKNTTITEHWHSDATFEKAPPKLTALYAKELPEVGGDTMFANQHIAFERLSPGMQKMLEGLRAIHSAGSLARHMTTEQEAEPWRIQGQAHPVIRSHSETGRKALYVCRGFVRGFEDMTPKESAPLLTYLYEKSSAPDLTMRHRWQEGDLVLWDNRSVLHYAVHDHGDAHRLMHRITVIGDLTE